MVRENTRDTIAAAATPPGEGGIGIVRLSGARALDIAGRIFAPKKRTCLKRCKGFSIHYGHVKDKDGYIDEALLTVMRAPRSYTREDVVEINCHGGMAALGKVLELALAEGARPAEPGEFTRRAFLNGRIDLAQAEAVLDIVRAKTSASLRSAVGQLRGRLSARVRGISEGLKEIYASVTAVIDFPEDVAPSEPSSWREGIDSALKSLGDLIETYHNGAILRDGISAVICGRPNVGKSSLMNVLLGHERVIVAPHPGTTRDTIEEMVNIKGIPIRLIDTAGIGKGAGEIEEKGMAMARASIGNADIALFMLDGSGDIDRHDIEIADMLREKRGIAILNKCDLPAKLDRERLRRLLGGKPAVSVSCLNGSGIGDLEKAIHSYVWSGAVSPSSDVMVTNIRHRDSLIKARDALREALNGMEKGAAYELLAADMKAAVGTLGEITGEIAGDEILDMIFSRFCIGK